MCKEYFKYLQIIFYYSLINTEEEQEKDRDIEANNNFTINNFPDSDTNDEEILLVSRTSDIEDFCFIEN